ncbi:MAG TPA: SDR family NAD(P)-dependent oxidoreductase [Actinoplanes sp.]|nr:SDR family NAD(P)-dependent oxidoreductase [Actinoplanes sp.]
MGKLDGKVAVITGATSGMALAGAKLFVDEGAHVFISGRRKDALDEAVRLIGRNVTGVQADSADLDDLDRLFETVKQETCSRPSSRKRARSTCCGQVPARANRAGSARSPRSSSTPPSR